MRQSIRGYADGIVHEVRAEGGDALRSFASDLAGVKGVLDGSEDLQSVLTDAGVPAPARRGVLVDLFGSRVGPATMRLLNYVVDADRASETVENVQLLSARADAAAGGLVAVGEGVLGHKAAEERVEGFASAVLESVAGERELADIEDELFRFSRVVAGSDELREALTSRDIPADARRHLVNDLVAAKCRRQTTALAAYATTVGRPRDYLDLLEVAVNRVAAEANRRMADVRSAVELDDAQTGRLAAALSRAVGHNVEIRVTVDPSVVGGFVATIGDTVVDGSARRQLELLKERLVTPEVNITTGERR